MELPNPCVEGAAPGPAPLRRLTAEEYRNTLTDLFRGVDVDGVNPVPEERIHAFENDVLAQPPSALAVERYADDAEKVAAAAVERLESWAPCASDEAMAPADCAASMAEDLAFRAYRRPLDEMEGARVRGFAREMVEAYGLRDGAETLVAALLESPHFLFRPEFGTETPGSTGGVELDPYEVASRLSYLFLKSMPDEALFAAAADGRLSTADGVEAEARRLMQTERARGAVVDFFWEWLGLYQLENLSLDDETFPEFDGRMRRDLVTSTRRFLETAIWEDDAYESLMLGHFGFVNDRIAPLFGVPAPGSEQMQRVELSATERRGILTQPGWLAATSHGIGHSPIFRGVKVLDRVLCSPAPPPPPEVLDSVGGPADDPEICTTRDHVAETHSSGSTCEACHALIDGAGFTFENYDALGRWRTTENGCPIDATGRVPLPGPADEISGPMDLAQSLAESREVADCFAQHFVSFAMGRRAPRADACQVEALAEPLLNGQGSLQDMMIAFVRSPAFRGRPVGQ